MRNLKEDKKCLSACVSHYNGDLSETDVIALEALERAIKAEKEVYRLQGVERAIQEYMGDNTYDGVISWLESVTGYKPLTLEDSKNKFINKQELMDWLNERQGVTAYDNLRMVVEYGKFDPSFDIDEIAVGE